MIRKITLLAILAAVLLAVCAPLHAGGCDPTAGDACEMPDHTRWRATDFVYLPLVATPGQTPTEMTRP